MVKKRMVSTVMSLMMAATVLTTVPTASNVKAADKEVTSGDYTYVKESNGKTSYAVLTSYKGSEANLVIPEELDGLQVKAISQGFEKNLKIKSITLSKNIASYKEVNRGIEVLSGIDTLEEVKVASANKDYQAADGVLYNKDKTELCVYPKSRKASSYVMPSSVKTADTMAGMKYLKNLTLSGNLTNTPDCENSSIESVVIPGKIKCIDENSFMNCKQLKKVTIGNNVRTIIEYAFAGCTSLKNLTIPDSVLYIESGTFYNTNVKLNKPAYLKKIKKQSGAVYYEAKATVKASGKKAVTYKASKITKIKAKTSKVTIKKGKIAKLQTRVYISKKLKKGYLDPEILKFTTSNKKVAKVSSKGTVKGLKKGTATITVKLRTTGKTYKVNVKVK